MVQAYESKQATIAEAARKLEAQKQEARTKLDVLIRQKKVNAGNIAQFEAAINEYQTLVGDDYTLLMAKAKVESYKANEDKKVAEIAREAKILKDRKQAARTKLDGFIRQGVNAGNLAQFKAAISEAEAISGFSGDPKLVETKRLVQAYEQQARILEAQKQEARTRLDEFIRQGINSKNIAQFQATIRQAEDIPGFIDELAQARRLVQNYREQEDERARAAKILEDKKQEARTKLDGLIRQSVNAGNIAQFEAAISEAETISGFYGDPILVQARKELPVAKKRIADAAKIQFTTTTSNPLLAEERTDFVAEFDVLVRQGVNARNIDQLRVVKKNLELELDDDRSNTEIGNRVLAASWMVARYELAQELDDLPEEIPERKKKKITTKLKNLVAEELKLLRALDVGGQIISQLESLQGELQRPVTLQRLRDIAIKVAPAPKDDEKKVLVIITTLNPEVAGARSSSLNLPYIVAPAFEEYSQETIDRMLPIRVMPQDAKIMKSFKIKDFNNRAVLDLAVDSIRQNIGLHDKILVPMMIKPTNEQTMHWVGLVIEIMDESIRLTYLDSENNPINAKFKQKLLDSFGSKLRFQQRYCITQTGQNCGPELIENFAYYVTGQRFSQEAAIYEHSRLFENYLLGQAQTPQNNGNRGLLLGALSLKELVEGLPVVKYFLSDIMHLPYSAPAILDNNYFKLGLHLAATNAGLYASGLEYSLPKASTPTLLYGTKLVVWQGLSAYKQQQNEPITAINGPAEFIAKCSFSAASQSLLSAFSSILIGTPIVYDLMIGAAVGSMECYNLHNQKAQSVTTTDNIKATIPYAVDAVVATASLSQMNFDLSSSFGKMLAVKQVFAGLSQIVMADYLTKLFISTIDAAAADNSENIASDSYSEDNLQTIGQGELVEL